MSSNQFTMIDDKDSTCKMKFPNVDQSMIFQQIKIDDGYEHHQDEPQPSLYVYMWQNSQKIGVFKDEENFLASGCK